jgi:Carboxypeptidase regulatory-like domain
MRGRALLALALALPAVALAGCSDAKAPADPAQDVDFDDLDLQATSTTGIIRGVVVDSAVRPIADALLELRGADQPATTRSNADGAFGFDALPPGDYFITANKSGYVQSQQSAVVVAGVAEPPIVKILLESDPSTVPYVQTYVFDGFIDCSFRAVVIGHATCSQAGTPNDLFAVSYTPAGTPDWWQSELVWESTQAFGSDLSLDISCLGGDPCPDGQVTINRSEGASPRHVTINRTLAEAFLLGTGQDVDIRVFAFGRSDTDVIDDDQLNGQLNSTSGGAVQCVEWPAVFDACMRFGGIGIIVQQRFTVYIHEFHLYTPPPGWVFSVDGEPPQPA